MILLLHLNIKLFIEYHKKKLNQYKENLILHIPENSNLKKISQIIEKNNLTPSYKFPYYLSIFLNYDRKLSYGEFLIKKNDTLYSILKKIRNHFYGFIMIILLIVDFGVLFMEEEMI